MLTDLHSYLISHPSPLIPNPSPLNSQSSTPVENIRQIILFLQNKPNFPHFSPENDDLIQKQTQYKANFAPISMLIKAEQIQFKTNLASVLSEICQNGTKIDISEKSISDPVKI